MKLEHIKGDVYYIPNPANIGVIRSEEKAILIDTGLDDDTARKILKTLEAENLYPAAIINTHAHGDHYGGNKFIKNKTDAPVYASALEADVIQNPYLEPYYLFSGADPIKDLQNKFLMGKPVTVNKVIVDTEINIEGVTLKIKYLPGHSVNHIGIIVDEVFFTGDAFFSIPALEKHRIPFNVNVEQQKNTLLNLKAINESSECEYFLPGHGKLSRDITMDLEANIKTIEEVKSNLLSIISYEKKTIPEIIQAFIKSYDIEINTNYLYFLIQTAILAYLSYLHNKSMLSTYIEDGVFYWKGG